MADDMILVNGTWVSKSSSTGQDYLRSIGMIPTTRDYTVQTANGPVTIKNVTPEQTGDRLVVSSTGEVYTGSSSGPLTSAVTGRTIDEPSTFTSDSNKDLEVVKAVQQSNGDIAYQVATPNGQTAIDSTSNNKYLSLKQKQQLRDYVKAHPEQQFSVRSADEEEAPVGMTVSEDSEVTMVEDVTGNLRPAVYDPYTGKYMLLNTASVGAADPVNVDNFPSADQMVSNGYVRAGNEPILDIVSTDMPGTSYKAAVVGSGTKVRLGTWDADDLIAIDVHGNRLMNAMYDPKTKTLKYLYAPASLNGTAYTFGDIAPGGVLDPTSTGIESIIESAARNYYSNKEVKPGKMLSSSLPGGQPNINLFGENGQVLTDAPYVPGEPQKFDMSALAYGDSNYNAPNSQYNDPAEVFRGLAVLGQRALESGQKFVDDTFNNPAVKTGMIASDLGRGLGVNSPFSSRNIIGGSADALLYTVTSVPIVVGSFGYTGIRLVEDPADTLKNLGTAAVVGVPAVAGGIAKSFVDNPVRTSIGIGGSLVIGKYVADPFVKLAGESGAALKSGINTMEEASIPRSRPGVDVWPDARNTAGENVAGLLDRFPNLGYSGLRGAERESYLNSLNKPGFREVSDNGGVMAFRTDTELGGDIGLARNIRPYAEDVDVPVKPMNEYIDMSGPKADVDPLVESLIGGYMGNSNVGDILAVRGLSQRSMYRQVPSALERDLYDFGPADDVFSTSGELDAFTSTMIDSAASGRLTMTAPVLGLSSSIGLVSPSISALTNPNTKIAPIEDTGNVAKTMQNSDIDIIPLQGTQQKQRTTTSIIDRLINGNRSDSTSSSDVPSIPVFVPTRTKMPKDNTLTRPFQTPRMKEPVIPNSKRGRRGLYMYTNPIESFNPLGNQPDIANIDIGAIGRKARRHAKGRSARRHAKIPSL